MGLKPKPNALDIFSPLITSVVARSAHLISPPIIETGLYQQGWI